MPNSCSERREESDHEDSKEIGDIESQVQKSSSDKVIELKEEEKEDKKDE